MFSGVFLSYNVNARRSMHSPRFHLIVSLIISRRAWLTLQSGKMVIGKEPGQELVATITKLFWQQHMPLRSRGLNTFSYLFLLFFTFSLHDVMCHPTDFIWRQGRIAFRRFPSWSFPGVFWDICVQSPVSSRYQYFHPIGMSDVEFWAISRRQEFRLELIAPPH
jgi:hypothetical protein